MRQAIACAVSALTVLLQAASASAATPAEWIEPATGHRVIRLSREAGSASLYFHQNAYSPEGDKLVITTPRGMETVDLKTREPKLIVPRGQFGGGGSSGIEVGRRTRHVFYSARGETGTVLRATHLDTGTTRDVVRLPFFAAFNGVTADESQIIGTVNERGPGPSPNTSAPRLNPRRGANGAAGPRAMKFFFADLKTGAVTTFHPSTNWLNHAQCSPADPALMLFCHEGPWHEVDRVWTMRPGTETPKLIHRRTMPYEIAGHEFFSPDGRWVWYDLQTPRSQEFWLAGVHLATGERIRYELARSEWSVHYNQSRDGTMFAGDGGGPGSVANHTPLPEKRRLNPPGNGQWIYLFRPGKEFTTRTIDGESVRIGRLRAEKLVDLSKHDYAFEPNVTFTPDGRWIVFRSNLHGERHVYAVEIAKAARTE